MERQRGRRFDALDSLRGVAAATVVLSHYTLLPTFTRARHTPLRLLLGGHEAVILFFALSGFVLTLQLESPYLTYPVYAAKRFCRIYLPYLGALAAALALRELCGGAPVAWAGTWANGLWRDDPTPRNVAAHVALIAPFATYKLVTVFWTLVYEMRISLIFPLVLFAASRLGAAPALALTLCGSLGVAILYARLGLDLEHQTTFARWLPTLHYLFMFACGSALAASRRRVAEALRGAGRYWTLLAAGVGAYFGARALTLPLHGATRSFVYDWVTLAGACALIACCLVEGRAGRALLWRPLRRLGAISYSLYLFHMTVMLTAIHALGARLSPTLVCVGALALTGPVAYVSYRFLEKPSMRLGDRFARRYEARSARREAVRLRLALVGAAPAAPPRPPPLVRRARLVDRSRR